MRVIGRMRGATAPLVLDGYAESMYPARFGWSPLKTLRDGRFKLIDAPRAELYDLERDPFETRNIHDERRTVARAMAVRLGSIAGRSARQEPGVPAGQVPEDLRERLTALGYVGSAAVRSPGHGGTLPDPKDCIHHYPRLSLAGSGTSVLRAGEAQLRVARNCEGFRQD